MMKILSSITILSIVVGCGNETLSSKVKDINSLPGAATGQGVNSEKGLGYVEPEVAVIARAREQAKKEGKILILKYATHRNYLTFEYELQSNKNGIRDALNNVAVVLPVYNIFQYLDHEMTAKFQRSIGGMPSFVVENPSTGKSSLVVGYEGDRLLSSVREMAEKSTLLHGTLARMKSDINENKVVDVQIVTDLIDQLSWEGSTQEILDTWQWLLSVVASKPMSFPPDRMQYGSNYNEYLKELFVANGFQSLVSNGQLTASELAVKFPKEFLALRSGTLGSFTKGKSQMFLNRLYFTNRVSAEIRAAGFLSAATKCEGFVEQARSADGYIPLKIPANASAEEKAKIEGWNKENEDLKVNSPARNVELCYALKAMTGLFNKAEIQAVLAMPEAPADAYGNTGRYKRLLLAFSGEFGPVLSSVNKAKEELFVAKSAKIQNAKDALTAAQKGTDQDAILAAEEVLKEAEISLQVSDGAYSELIRAYEAGVTHPLLIKN
jgi:hypothetical protein